MKRNYYEGGTCLPTGRQDCNILFRSIKLKHFIQLVVIFFLASSIIPEAFFRLSLMIFSVFSLPVSIISSASSIKSSVLPLIFPLNFLPLVGAYKSAIIFPDNPPTNNPIRNVLNLIEKVKKSKFK